MGLELRLIGAASGEGAVRAIAIRTQKYRQMRIISCIHQGQWHIAVFDTERLNSKRLADIVPGLIQYDLMHSHTMPDFFSYSMCLQMAEAAANSRPGHTTVSYDVCYTINVKLASGVITIMPCNHFTAENVIFIDFEAFIATEAACIPSELGMIKVYGNTVVGSLHFLFQPTKEHTHVLQSQRHKDQVQLIEQLTGIRLDSVSGGVELTDDGIADTRDNILKFCYTQTGKANYTAPPKECKECCFVAKDVRLERRLLERYFQISDRVNIFEFETIYAERHGGPANLDDIHSGREFNYCGYHKGLGCCQNEHCALDDAAYLAGKYLGMPSGAL